MAEGGKHHVPDSLLSELMAITECGLPPACTSLIRASLPLPNDLADINSALSLEPDANDMAELAIGSPSESGTEYAMLNEEGSGRAQ
jgi:hypothetical protein